MIEMECSERENIPSSEYFFQSAVVRSLRDERNSPRRKCSAGCGAIS